MAFQTGSASSFADLISQLSTFLTANTWIEDERDNGNGDFAFSKGGIFVSGRWDTSSVGTFSLHQATAFDGAATLPGDHTGDSGNGFNTSSSHLEANLDNERHVDLESDGPYPNYWFFENNASPAYVHVVVEFVTDKYAHFGFGELSKIGDWTGGEYCYGNKHTSTNELSTSSTWLLDGFFQDSSGDAERMAATMRMTGVAGQPGGSVWLQIWGRDNSIPADSAANAKAFGFGGFRSGPYATHLGMFVGSLTTGFVPGYPIALWFADGVISTPSGTDVKHLGYMLDVRGVNMRNFAPAERVGVGGETWYLFPARWRELGASAGATGYAGIMYRREDA